MKDLNLRKLFLYVLIASVSTSALIGIAVIIIGNFGDLEAKILSTAMTVTVTSILGLACGAFYETGRGRIVPLTGIVAALVAAVLMMFVIWRGDSDTLAKSTMTATLLAFSLSHTSLLSLARLDKRFIWVQWVVRIAIASLTSILLYLIWANGNDLPEWLSRTMGVLAIVISALTVTTPIFHRLSNHELSNSEIDAQIEELRKRIEELESKKI